MIVVTGHVVIPAARREELAALATEMCVASRSDDGCGGYRVYEDLEQPNRYLFVEEWRDEQALHSHFAQPHTGRFMAALVPMLAAPADARFHTVASTRRLDAASGLVPVA